MMKILSVIGLITYFATLLFIVSREKKNETVLDYFFAGRTLPFWALSITFIASWWGAGSALSTADLGFTDGIGAFWYYGVPVLVATFIMMLGAKIIRRVGYLTQGEMMKSRYNTLSSKLLAVMIIFYMTFNASSQMVGIGDFFGTYLGIKYETAVFIGTSIVLIYSVIGGFRGVVLTDIIQFILLLLSAIIVFCVAIYNAQGFDNIEKIAYNAGKLDFMNFSAGASKYFVYVITFGGSWAIAANVWQRISAAKNNSDARKMTIMSFIVYIPLYLIVVLTGMAGITMYENLPQGGIVTAIVLDYTPPILGALVFIGISAAIMSTMDSLVNTAAMTLIIDIAPENLSEKTKVKLSKFATFIVIAVGLIIALKIRSILDISWIASDIITTGVLVPLLMGFFWKRGNSAGAVSSIIIGSLFCLYNLLIQLDISLPTYWEFQSPQQAIIGISLSLITYISVSLITKSENTKAENFINKSLKDNN